MAIDTIKATAILDGSVDTADLADNAVTSAKITDGNVTSAKIGDGEVSDAKIASGVTASKLTGALPAIDGSSLTGVDPADGSITTAKLADNAVTAGKIGSLPAGSVLQVVEGVRTSIVGTTSTSLVTVGLSASITPASSSNTVLVTVYLNGVYAESSSAALFELYRGGGSIAYLNDITGYHIPSGANNGESTAISYLDSPSSTSSLTYEVYMRSSNGNQIYINNYATGNNRTRSTITLMEIAG